MKGTNISEDLLKNARSEVHLNISHKADYDEQELSKVALRNAKRIMKELKKDKYKIPIDIFPIEIQEFINSYHKCYGFGKEFYFGAILSVTGVLIGNKYAAQYHEKWWASPLYWILLSGASSTGKSQVINHCIGPLKKVQKKQLENNLGDIQKWEQDNFENSKLKNQPETDDKPRTKQILTNQATIESVIELLEKNPNGFILIRGEFMGFLESLNKQHSGGAQQTYMEVWDNDGVMANTKGEGLRYIDRPNMGMLGGIQTEIIEKIASSQNAKTGFFQRFLVCLLQDNKVPMPKKMQPDFAHIERYEKIMMKLYNLPSMVIEKDKDIPYTANQVNTIMVPMTEEASALFFKYRCDITVKMNSAEDNIIRALLGKLITYALRFSISMELLDFAAKNVAVEEIPIETIDKLKISLSSMKKAIKIVNYFENTGKAVVKRVENPANGLTESQKAWYRSITKTIDIPFKTSFALDLAIKMEDISESTAKRLLKRQDLFKKSGHGFYSRIQF